MFVEKEYKKIFLGEATMYVGVINTSVPWIQMVMGSPNSFCYDRILVFKSQLNQSENVHQVACVVQVLVY